MKSVRSALDGLWHSIQGLFLPPARRSTFQPAPESLTPAGEPSSGPAPRTHSQSSAHTDSVDSFTANTEGRLDAAVPTLSEPDTFRFVGATITILGILMVGLVLQAVGISQINHDRDQVVAYQDFRFELANATAPTGQVDQTTGKLLAMGTPVAIVEAPSIGLSEVVMEGTTSSVMQSGPGHRRDTPLPGQAGTSVVYGRQATFGGPFSALGTLAVGDTITATTGQGAHEYTVTGVRKTGDPLPAPVEAGGSRLTLVSAAGTPFLPDDVVRVDATLKGETVASPGYVLAGYTALGEDEHAMAGDPSGWALLVLSLATMFGVLALVSLLRNRWGRWQAWVVAVPVLALLGTSAAQQVLVLLPNMI